MSPDDRFFFQSPTPTGTGASGERFLRLGVVASSRYPHSVQVRTSLDRHLPDAQLPWCTPLLPTGFLPAKGEVVRVFFPDPAHPLLERYWAGPVITSWEFLAGQPYPSAEVTINEKSWASIAGSLPVAKDDTRHPDPAQPQRVHQLTRGNGDAVFTEQAAFLRTARHDWVNSKEANRRNPAVMGLIADPVSQTSTALLQAERIVLRTHGNAGSLPESGEVETPLHPLAFADEVGKALEVIRQALLNHLHPSSGKPAIQEATIRALRELDLSHLGSERLLGN